MMEIVNNREIGVRYNNKFGKRPNILKSKDDILKYAKEGATSFHASIERWSDPMKINDNLNDLEKLRIGWDLIFDIDADDLRFSKIAAVLILKTLKVHGIKNFSIKFSGRGGFHIGVPFESFPKRIGKIDIAKYFPYGLRIIAEYISNIIENPLRERIMELHPKIKNENLLKGKLNPFSLVSIDSIAISQRHMFRMPYSINEKTGLVSIPIEENHIEELELKEARIENVNAELGFLDKYKEGEARRLFILAFDFKEKEKKKIKRELDFSNYKRIDEKFFPPCIKNILMGLKDGRKRSLFILMNFLKAMSWNYNEIENKILNWNSKNKPPLRESYIRGQLKWFQNKGLNYTLPSCDNSIYYKDIGVCIPDQICKRIKNPMTYPFKAMKFERNKLGRNKRTSKK